METAVEVYPIPPPPADQEVWGSVAESVVSSPAENGVSTFHTQFCVILDMF